MLRLSLLLVVLTHPIRTAYVTSAPSFAARLDRFYEKLERLTVGPPPETTDPDAKTDKTAEWDLKLEKLNSLSPDNFFLSDDEDELLSTMQAWGNLSPEQLEGMVKELQRLRDEGEDRSERLMDQDWYSMDDNDDEYIDPDYHNDGKDDEDDEESETSSPSPRPNVTPFAYTRDDSPYVETIVSAVDPIAATNERPRILDDSSLTALDRYAVRQAAIANMGRVMRAGKCLVPQPRWLKVRQLAPAADISYLPPCIELHRCAPDSGCCYDEAQVCAPIDGKYVAIPLYLQKADQANPIPARMLFFNHTQCACVSRDTLQTTVRSHARKEHQRFEHRPVADERHNDLQRPTDAPSTEKEEEVTAPPQMRRCTCPAQFLASMHENKPCSCVCEWPDATRRRDCLSLARGKEHFGMRDRVCVASGDCTPPTCEYGAYDRAVGKCPMRRYRRLRYHVRRYQPEKTAVV